MTLTETLRIAGWALLAVGAVSGAIAAMVAAIRWARRAPPEGDPAGQGTDGFGAGIVPPRDSKQLEETRQPRGGASADAGTSPAADDD